MNIRTRMMLMFGLMTAASTVNAPYSKPGDIHTDPAILKQKKDYNAKKRMNNMGLQKFTIDGITVMALNMKNAIKKVNKIKAKR